MWIVDIYEVENGEWISVVASNFDELIKILNFINERNDLLRLVQIKENQLLFGFESLKEVVKN